ncbi:hypothetical protein XENOCAPTIV_022799 [Xenoophorus captivus]|uniref:Uncharacterized protein n=1 Tax=Xenoophorus captivus TaxID=1517983 RepID=A0ABV0S3T3_9TELE
MFWTQIHYWVKVLHCAPSTKSFLQLPDTCKYQEGTNLYSGSPACRNPAYPPSNLAYTSLKETGRNKDYLTITSPVKLSLRGVTHLSPRNFHFFLIVRLIYTFRYMFPRATNIHLPLFLSISTSRIQFPDDRITPSCVSINLLNCASVIIGCIRVAWFIIMTFLDCKLTIYLEKRFLTSPHLVTSKSMNS